MKIMSSYLPPENKYFILLSRVMFDHYMSIWLSDFRKMEYKIKSYTKICENSTENIQKVKMFLDIKIDTANNFLWLIDWLVLTVFQSIFMYRNYRKVLIVRSYIQIFGVLVFRASFCSRSYKIRIIFYDLSIDWF